TGAAVVGRIDPIIVADPVVLRQHRDATRAERTERPRHGSVSACGEIVVGSRETKPPVLPEHREGARVLLAVVPLDSPRAAVRDRERAREVAVVEADFGADVGGLEGEPGPAARRIVVVEEPETERDEELPSFHVQPGGLEGVEEERLAAGRPAGR